MQLQMPRLVQLVILKWLHHHSFRKDVLRLEIEANDKQ